MKSVIGIMTLGLVLLLSVPAKAQPGVSVSIQTFYDELSPYGEWIDDPSYGYVWRPQVSSNFRPYYTNGNWVMTEYGNTWVSDYDWGWAPFHYGRWTYDDYYGWIWLPDTEWGPAWVSWRDGGGYYGWAPMGPNISVSMSFGPQYYVPNNWWVFIPYNYMYRNDFHRHYRGPRYNTTIINQTTIINNSYRNRYAYGPRANEFQGHTGQRVNVYNINNINRPQRTSVRGNTVDLYRPHVVQGGARGSQRPQNAVRPERPLSPSAANNNPRTTTQQQRPAPTETQVTRPAGRDMNRNDVRINNNNNTNVPQARPERNDANRADRQRAEVQRPSQQQAIENNRQQQWERQRATQVQQQQAQQQQAQQAQRQQQADQQRQQQQAQRQQQMDQQRQQQAQQQQVQQAQRQQQMDQQRQQQQMQRQQAPQRMAEPQRMEQRSAPVERQQSHDNGGGQPAGKRR